MSGRFLFLGERDFGEVELRVEQEKERESRVR